MSEKNGRAQSIAVILLSDFSNLRLQYNVLLFVHERWQVCTMQLCESKKLLIVLIVVQAESENARTL